MPPRPLSLPIEDLHPDFLPSSRLRAGAHANQTIHLSPEVNVGLNLGADLRIEHLAGIRIDAHRLEYIERAWYVLRRNVPSFKRFAEILPTAMIRNILRLLGIQIHALGKFSLCESLGDQLESLPAAHPLLQIMPPFFESVFDDGEQRIVELRDKLIADGDKDLDLIGLGPRLVEPLS